MASRMLNAEMNLQAVGGATLDSNQRPLPCQDVYCIKSKLHVYI
jgi:hypothetical protein